MQERLAPPGGAGRAVGGGGMSGTGAACAARKNVLDMQAKA